MNDNAKLLNYIYKNSQMGVETIDRIIKLINDQNLKNHLENQHNEYGEINKKAIAMLNKNGYDEKGINAFDKFKIAAMTEFETIKDNSSSHIAEMLIIGSNMGIIQAIKNLKKYKNVESEIAELMSDLKESEENNVKELKNFL